MELASISNRQLKLLRKLNQKKYRQEYGLFLVEGARAVEQVIEHGKVAVDSLFFDESQEYWIQEPWREYRNEIEGKKVNSGDFRQVSDTDTPQGVLAVCRIPGEASIHKLAATEGVIIAADAIQDPGNLGTLIRTASWFGTRGILLGKGTVDLFHPKVVRSTAGATGTVPHINVDLTEQLNILEEEGWNVFLLDTGENASNLREVKIPAKAVLLIGNEARGIDAGLMFGKREKVKIPSYYTNNQVESLNAAVAAAIAMYRFAEGGT